MDPNRAHRVPLARRLAYSLALAALTYAAIEGVTTKMYTTGRIDPVPYWILEDTGEGRSVAFDPIRGYRLSATHPARMGVFTSAGTVASIGALQGNNEGFPDRDDFFATAGEDVDLRYAVFGRSFTAAQFLQRNWPDAAEDIAAAGETRLELMNLSIDGGGAVNWWSVIQRFLEPGGYEVDRMVFAINPADLYAGFTIWDDRLAQCGADQQCLAQGWVPTNDLRKLPRNLSEAAQWFTPALQWQVVPTAEFDQLVSGRKRMKYERPFELFIAGRVLGRSREEGRSPVPNLGPASPHYAPPASGWMSQRESWEHGSYVIEQFVTADYDRPVGCGGECIDMMMDLRWYLQQNRIPSMVVYIPDPWIFDGGMVREARWFAAVTGSAFVDGCTAFAGMDVDEVEDSFIPRDGHWNQQGSDRFASLMADVLATWEP